MNMEQQRRLFCNGEGNPTISTDERCDENRDLHKVDPDEKLAATGWPGKEVKPNSSNKMLK